MSPLKEALILLKGMTFDELTNVQVFLEVLMEVTKPDEAPVIRSKVTASPRHGTMGHVLIESLGKAKKSLTEAQLAARRANLDKARAKRWTKPKAKKKTTRRSYNDFNPRAVHQQRVWEALTQSSGQLTAKELGEVLELPAGRVSAALSALWQGRHRKKMSRLLVGKEFRYTYENGDDNGGKEAP
jgi:hypothetical protein